MKRTLLAFLVTSLTSQLYAAAPSTLAIKRAAERTFNASAKVVEFEDFLDAKLPNKIGYGTYLAPTIIEKDCDDAEVCVYIVSVAKEYLSSTNKVLARAVGKYAVNFPEAELAIEEISLRGTITALPAGARFSEKEIKAAAMEAFAASETVAIQEDYVASKIGTESGRQTMTLATIIETDCTNVGECSHILSVVEEFSDARGIVFGRVIGKYLVETNKVVELTREVSVIGNTLK
jgi:hypothetical protein